jgi:hypothetical protein
VVTRAPVAPQVLGSTPRGANFSGFNGVCAFSGFRRQRGACGDFVNLEDLLAQSSKMLLGVEFACVCIHRDECACVVSVSDVLCNSQKNELAVVKDKLFIS